jgi:hypothetical protein
MAFDQRSNDESLLNKGFHKNTFYEANNIVIDIIISERYQNHFSF